MSISVIIGVLVVKLVLVCVYLLFPNILHPQ